MDQSLFKFDLSPTIRLRTRVPAYCTPRTATSRRRSLCPWAPRRTSRVFLPRPSSSWRPGRACEHLSPVHAPRRRHHRRGRRRAQVYELRRPHAHRFGRLPGVQPRRHDQARPDGVTFTRAIYDGSSTVGRPRQHGHPASIGADIVMQLDQCTPIRAEARFVAAPSNCRVVGRALLRRIPATTRRFSASCRAACISTCAACVNACAKSGESRAADIRASGAIGIGGYSVGEGHETMFETLGQVCKRVHARGQVRAT